MNFTLKQLKDFETIEYFIPEILRDIIITNKDRRMFLELSEKGLHKDLLNRNIRQMKWYKENSGRKFEELYNGFEVLVEGKRWRGIHMHEMYEQGILDGSMPYFVILGGCKGEKLMPRSVIDFIKKEMFKGAASDLIEETYQKVLQSKNEV